MANRKFYVLTWDFNTDRLEHYDVLPYFRRCWEKQVERAADPEIIKLLEEYPENRKYYAVPGSYEEFRKFVESESQYMFWARCEWEMIIHGWPVRKDDYKIDVHEQVMMNLDTIAGILMEENLMKPSKIVEFERK